MVNLKFVECQNPILSCTCTVAVGIVHLQASHQGMYSPCLLE